MKRLIYLLLCFPILQSCCTDGNCEDDVDTLSIVSDYEPITLEREVFENSVLIEESRPIINSGKIYVISDLLFVNEKNEGFHIFDNENPENPLPLSFIKAPGATDIAIKNDVFFINQAVDLIAVIYEKETNSLEVTKRVRNVFPVMASPDGYTPNITDDTVIVHYRYRS